MTSIKKSLQRKKAADKIIRRRMLYAAGLGLIPIPIIDAAAILSVQVLMIRDIAGLYQIPFKSHRVKSFIGSLLGSSGAIGAVKIIPGLGSLLGGITVSLGAAAATYAIGKIFTQHFDQGGTLLNFDPVESRQYFQKLYEEGKQQAESLQTTQSSEEATTNAPMAGTKEVAKSTPAAKTAKAQALKAKRHNKLLKARRRRSLRRKWLKRLVFLLILGGTGAWVFFHYRVVRVPKLNEIETYMHMTKPVKITLQPNENLDSAVNSAIAAFSSNSTEGIIAKYLQNPDAVYPVRYTLSDIRFVGNAVTLSSGAEEHLKNIALLMKKYPALIVHFYGYTSNVGPEMVRQRTGRDRARALTSVIEEEGIPSYRLMGSYTETAEEEIQPEYSGAEIIIDVSTKENSVTARNDSLPVSSKSRRQLDTSRINLVNDSLRIDTSLSKPLN